MADPQTISQDMQALPAVGFLGVGQMVGRMARRLLEAGYPVNVYNRSPGRAEAMAAAGANVRDVPRDVARSCELLLSCLSDDAAVEAVYFGPDGAIAGLQPGSTVVDFSTVAPHVARTLEQAITRKGGLFLDSGVSGSTPQAEQGRLILFAGGNAAVFERCRPLLDVLAAQSFLMGPTGSGKATKLVVNALLGVGMQALGEAIALGEKAGLEKDKLLDALHSTEVIGDAHKAKIENVRREEYPVQFALRLMAKDFNLVFRLATDLAVPMPATAAAQQACVAEVARGIEEDFSSVIWQTEQQAGVASPVRI